jgi:hypothetical protein
MKTKPSHRRGKKRTSRSRTGRTVPGQKVRTAEGTRPLEDRNAPARECKNFLLSLKVTPTEKHRVRLAAVRGNYNSVSHMIWKLLLAEVERIESSREP